jgi:HD-GYP domain-containing protein (c-di-GMP phosphodiesterase class II)
MMGIDENSEILQVIKELNAAIACTRMYFPEHPQVIGYVDAAYREIKALLHARSNISLMLVDDQLVYLNRRIKSEGPRMGSFVQVLRDSGVGQLTIVRGMPKGDLQRLVCSLAFRESASISSSGHIKLGRVGLQPQSSQQDLYYPFEDDETVLDLSDVPDEETITGDSLFDPGLEKLKEFYTAAVRHKTFGSMPIGDIVRTIVNNLMSGIHAYRMLASIRSADEYTFTHAANVAILTTGQADRLGFKGARLHEIGVAAMLHDIGKLFIPEEIIKKPGKLTSEERLIVNTHPTKGALYLHGGAKIPQLAVLTAMEHHMRYDGQGGYPDMKSAWVPHLVSRMIAIADVFDAMRSRRPYQEPRPVSTIINILKEERGKALDPYLVGNFLELLESQSSPFASSERLEAAQLSCT